MKNAIFMTGATGYLGAYTIDELLRTTDAKLYCLVRASSPEHAWQRCWDAWQSHMDREAFEAHRSRVVPVLGSLHEPLLGLSNALLAEVSAACDSILHVAASLNRKSSKACFQTNLIGTMEAIKLAERMDGSGGLQRFTDVSTSAVAGRIEHATLDEVSGVDWSRSDYDPYSRTKRFAEHMVRRCVGEDKTVVVRPSTVMGDSRRGAAKITDMVAAFCGMARLPLVPLHPSSRIDIVPGDWAGCALARLHTSTSLQANTFNLTAGEFSPTYQDIAVAMRAAGVTIRFAPTLAPLFVAATRAADSLPRGPVQRAGAVMRVFWPYLTQNVVFDNTRICEQLQDRPPPFVEWCAPMYEYAVAQGMVNPTPSPL